MSWSINKAKSVCSSLTKPHLTLSKISKPYNNPIPSLMIVILILIEDSWLKY